MEIMKTKFKTTLLFFCFLCISSVTNASPILNLSTTSNTYNIGDTVTVAANISGLGDFAPDSLGSYDIDFLFDSSIFQFSNVTTTLLLGDEFFGEVFNSIDISSAASGTLNVTQVSFLDPDPINCIFCFDPYLDEIQPESFTLFSIDLLAITSGNGLFNLSNNGLGDGFGDPLNANFQNLPLQISVAGIASVPAPASIVLILLGLMLIVSPKMLIATKK